MLLQVTWFDNVLLHGLVNFNFSDYKWLANYIFKECNYAVNHFILIVMSNDIL